MLLHRVTKMVAMVMMLIGFSAAFGYMMALMQVPARATQFFIAIASNKYELLMMINILLILLGTFMDMAPMILICTPILLPVILKFGIDPVHFGMILLVNSGIGLITPPVGPTLFVGCAIGKVTMEEVSRELWPFYGAMCAALLDRHLRAGAVAVAAAPAGALAAAAARELAEPLDALGVGHRVELEDLARRGAPSSSFLTGSSIFLPDSVRGIEATWKISFGTWRAESAALMRVLQAPRQRVVERDAVAQDDEERHVALAAEVLEVDDEAVEHLRQGLDRAVQLGRSHADAVAVDGRVAAPVDDRAAAAA